MTIVFRAEILCDGEAALGKVHSHCCKKISRDVKFDHAPDGLAVVENAHARKEGWRRVHNPRKDAQWHLCPHCLHEFKNRKEARKAHRTYNYKPAKVVQ